MRKRGSEDSIAIIGMAFRFPGDLCDERSFWAALTEGRDVIGQIGEDRWAVNELRHSKRSEPGKSITFSAGVLSRVDEFDASFFGISPREASWLDPQQRLLLEMAWEAMENAGKVPETLAGSDSAVFVGISSLDYGVRGIADLAAFSPHVMTGNTLSVAANRLSYIFDFRGPSMSVDTACSSSLVALHQACNSLRRGEASMALVGGVNMLLHPYPFVGFTKASMISGGGKCRAFDASADGYVRAEGGAVLLLKPLAQAEEDGDTIHAVIIGSGVNADGGQKTGITIPSSAGQTALMRSVLKRAKLAPGQIDYIEAHGTGTSVGDPIEARAIGDVYGRDRDAPLPIGSVKSNLGHLEAASGMAGLIKIIEMLKHRQLLPSINFNKPNPNIDFNGLNLKVVTECAPLTKGGAELPIMGVNSFGFGGANAHVLLQGYAAEAKVAAVVGELPVPPLVVSARTPEALAEAAGLYSDLLNSPEPVSYYDVAYSAAFHRQPLEHRLVVKGKDADSIASALSKFAQGEKPKEVVVEKALTAPAGVAFIYSGNGAQYVGMGKRLLSEMPRFGVILAELDAAMKDRVGFSLVEMLNVGEAESRLDDTSVAQPLLFAMQVAITTLLREQGLEAEAVAGHSTGEVAAAWASGALTLDQAITTICARSAAQAKARGGKMAAAGMSEQGIRKAIKDGKYKTIEVAGINSPGNVTLAGSFEELDDLRKKLEANGTFYRILDLDYAFHSRSMEAIREDLAARLGDLAAANSSIDFVSTVTGKLLKGKNLGAAYWWDNVRQPVRFAKAMETLIARGCRVFVEIGPNAILQRYMTECLTVAQATGCVLPALRKKEDGADRLNETAMRMRLCVPQPNFKAWFPVKGNFVPLPNYPWQREKFWIPKTSEFVPVIENRRVHPLLGWRLKDAEAAWENVLDTVESPWLADHCVAGAVVFPGAGYVEVALAAAKEWFGGSVLELEELEILSPIVFDGEQGRSFRFELNPQEGTFRFLSRPRLSDDAWSLNAKGRLLVPGKTVPQTGKVAEVTGDAIGAEEHYARASGLGLAYGAAFQGFVSATVGSERMVGKLRLPQVVEELASSYLLHPAVLDSCFQALINFFTAEIEAGYGTPYLPIKVGRLRFFGGASPAAFDVVLKRRGLRSVLADISLYDADGNVVGALEDCRFRAAFMQRKADAAAAKWRIDAELVPHPADGAAVEAVSNADLKAQVLGWFAASEEKLQRKKYLQDGVALFNALSVAFAYAAFKEREEKQPGWIQETLSSLDGVPFGKRALLVSLKKCLQNVELLKEVDGTWALEMVDAPPPAEEIWGALLAEFPEALPELLFAGRVGRNLSAVLNDQGEGLKASLEKSSFLQSLYDDAPFYRGMNLALTEALRGIGKAWPANRRLRVLEISGGSTELAYQLASALPSDRTDFVKASENAEMLGQLKAEYQGHPVINVASLKLEDMSLEGEGKLPAVYDVIVVHHWLSRAASPAAVLGALRHKLAKGGRLIVAERPRSYVADLMFGLTEGWWRGTNEPVSCLLDPAGWAGVMKAHGFEEIETVVEPEDEEARSGAYLLFAKAAQVNDAAAEVAPACWLVVADKAGLSTQVGEKVATRLKSRGQHVVVAPMGKNLLDKASVEMGKVDSVVYLAGMRSDDSAEAAASSRCYGALKLVHALAARKAETRLWMVTNGGALVTEQRADWNVHPAEAQLWGFGRVVMNEHSNLNCTLIDIAGDIEDVGMADRILNELLEPDGESEVVLASDARFGLRMRRDEAASKGEATRFKLDFQVPGQLRNLLWLPQEERVLKDHEVEVRPVASGINFRDIMYTMGLLPDEAVEKGFSGPNLGLECAGVVSRVGGKVSKVKPGDEVMGFGSACFASHVVTTEGAVAKKPEGWSFAQAATVPTAFFTVYYALKHLANLQPGERILIHGAAGGVGIAAMQIARYMGAEVFVTAGSDEKRDFVRLLGAEHVSDSRSFAFADDILAQTNGEGVDVVLNSLAGEAINRNMRVLRPFGRFLELGKRDFYENTHIGLRPFKDNINYYGIDTDQLLTAKPELAARLFDEVMALFDDGTLFPLPYSVFPAERIVDAFRYMQQSKHIGKVVVDLSEAKVAVEQIRKKEQLTLEAQGTYLVTGGLGGFGLESAKWLAERGAGQLVLLSRRGMETPGASDAVAQIEALGAKARVFACDVSDRAALENVFSAIKDLPPLKGVLHAAMVLDDALMMNLDEKRFGAVLTPKVMGAWNLHQLTSEMALDFFALYSSVTTSIGNPGQANYVSANGFLQALAGWRRKQGLPATCANWGPIGDAGYLTRNTDVKDSLSSRLGAKPLASRAALESLGQLILHKKSDITVADFDWDSLSRVLPSAGVARFDVLRRSEGAAGAKDSSASDIYVLIAGKPIEEVTKIVKELIILEVAKILCIGPERIDSSRPLSDIGMDSLMVVELALAIEQRMGVNLPAMALSEGAGSIDKICAKLADKLCGGEEKRSDNLESLVDAIAAQHNENLSAEDVAETVAEIKRQTHSEVRRIA